MSAKHLYIFLDEGGNLDFSPSGTKYFTLTSVAMMRPFQMAEQLDNLKYDCIDLGLNIEYFHATEDKQGVRDQVFAIIQSHLENIQIDTLIVEKRKTGTTLQDSFRFYPEMIGYLLKYPLERKILNRHQIVDLEEVIVITDSLPVKKTRGLFEKTIKTILKRKLPMIRHRVMHHSSKSSMELQIADYCNWAIFRKWERGDSRSYDLIKRAIKSEFDIFEIGNKYYY